MNMGMRKILIAGGSGLIGTRLTERLLNKGYQVAWLSRTPGKEGEVEVYSWDVKRQVMDQNALEGTYGVINLAGAGVADGRWSDARKRLITKSRTESTRLLGSAIGQMATPPRVFIGASAIGYYGDRGNEILTEESDPGRQGFLPESVLAIEAAIRSSAPKGVRTVIPRFGVVLSSKGGALAKLLFPLSLGAAVYMGSGRQYFSWVHIDDVCLFLEKALEDESFSGTYNLTAPDPVSWYDFAGALQKAWSSWSLRLPAPAFILRLIFGEMADTLLDSARVIPDRLTKAGFIFQHEELVPALRHIKKEKV